MKPNDLPPSLSTLKFITCGSVDDGKSTLIGRLLLDTKAVLQDHLAGVQRAGQTDLALLTDGLVAEREQGITIDVAWRYFATEQRKFIIGDTPGHEQYTRNMVTAASHADAAVVLVDATKLDWHSTEEVQLLPQTRRHTLLCQLLRVPHLLFAVNKLDAVDDPATAFARIRTALLRFTANARIGLSAGAVLPISALKGWNVVQPQPGWCGHHGPSLLDWLHAAGGLSTPAAARGTPTESPTESPPPSPASPLDAAFSVQWVEKSASSSSDTTQGRRIFWGRVAWGRLRVGQALRVQPGGHRARVAQVLSPVREPLPVGHPGVAEGRDAGVVLDRELDVSRGDWLLGDTSTDTPTDTSLEVAATPSQRLSATVAWLDDEPLVPGRAYWLLHGHRWIKAKVQAIGHHLNIHTLAREEARDLRTNAIGEVALLLQEPIVTLPYATSRHLGAMILVDPTSHRTAGAVMVNPAAAAPAEFDPAV